MRTRTAFLSIALLALFIASLPSLALSAPLGALWFEEGFESYNVGDIAGQGDGSPLEWAEGGYSDSVHEITELYYTEGSKGVFHNGGSDSLSRTCSDVNDSAEPSGDTGYVCFKTSVSTEDQYEADPSYNFVLLKYYGSQSDVAMIDFGRNGDINYFTTDLNPIIEDYVPGQIYNLCIEWDHSKAPTPLRYWANGISSDWVGGFYGAWGKPGKICVQSHKFDSDDIVYWDNFNVYEAPPANYVSFTGPENESTQVTDFYITGTWSNVDPEDYNEVQLFLGREDSFTMQFLCTTEISTTTGNFSCLVEENEWYQQNWIVQPLLTLKSCDEYGNCTYLNDKASNDPTLHITFAGDFSTSTIPALTIEGYTYETQWDSFAGFYASTSDRWSTSTNIGISLDNSIGAVLNWIFNLSSQLEVLDTDKESAGVSIGLAIQQGRGYLDTINNLFSGFPLGQIFSVYIIVFLLVLIIRLIKLARSLLPFI